MNLTTLININSDPKQKQFLRENSYWYKYLNRNSSYYKEFISEMKQAYKLTTTDRINKISTDLNMIKSIIDVLK